MSFLFFLFQMPPPFFRFFLFFFLVSIRKTLIWMFVCWLPELCFDYKTLDFCLCLLQFMKGEKVNDFIHCKCWHPWFCWWFVRVKRWFNYFPPFIKAKRFCENWKWTMCNFFNYPLVHGYNNIKMCLLWLKHFMTIF
jgi:hypothetical protein